MFDAYIKGEQAIADGGRTGHLTYKRLEHAGQLVY